MSIALEVQLEDSRRINVTFATDEVAAGYVKKNRNRFYFNLPQEIKDEDAPLLIDALFPSCEHGLSLDLCSGPGHYPMDNPWD